MNVSKERRRLIKNGSEDKESTEREKNEDGVQKSLDDEHGEIKVLERRRE